MENGLKTIYTLFNGDKHFVIPKYQRAYSWDEKQLKDFIDDIHNQRDDKEYFFGTILFQNNGISNGFEQIDIVDGQQRITTLIIFMKTLLKQIKIFDPHTNYYRDIRRYLKDENFYKLELIQLDNDFFKTYIIEDNTLDEKFIKTPSQKRLIFAKKYFEKQLENTDAIALKKYKEKIEKTQLLTYSVNDTAEATLIFETTNDRGKSLTNLEKTKSFLMHKIYLTKDKPIELLNSIHDRFSEIYRIIEGFTFNIDEDSVLQYHFISHLHWSYTRKRKDYQRYVENLKGKINLMIKDKKLKEASEFINNYSRELLESFQVLDKILKDNDKFVRDLIILGRMVYFYPLLIKCYKYDRTSAKNDFYKIVRLLEIFSFRVYGIGRKPSHTGETKLYTLAKNFDGNFPELRKELNDKIKEYVYDDLFKSQLKLPYFYHDMSPVVRKYLFWKYENHLRSNEQPIASEMSEKEFLSENSKTKLTIEHIASQKPKVTTSKLIMPIFDEDFKNMYLHSLGNLTFDPNSANASKGNRGILIKSTKYFIKAPFKTQNELNDFIHGNEWDKHSIEKRAEKVINFALRYWDSKTLM